MDFLFFSETALDEILAQREIEETARLFPALDDSALAKLLSERNFRSNEILTYFVHRDQERRQ